MVPTARRAVPIRPPDPDGSYTAEQATPATPLVTATASATRAGPCRLLVIQGILNELFEQAAQHLSAFFADPTLQLLRRAGIIKLLRILGQGLDPSSHLRDHLLHHAARPCVHGTISLPVALTKPKLPTRG